MPRAATWSSIRTVTAAAAGILLLATPAFAVHVAPPRGWLSVEADSSVVGDDGSYCLDSGDHASCGDIGELPRSPVTRIEGGETIGFQLNDGWAIERWVVAYQRYTDGRDGPDSERRLAEGRAPKGSPRSRITFEGPPAGDWRLMTFVRFVGPRGSGDTSFYWRLSTLPETAVTAPTPSRSEEERARGAMLAAAAAGIGFAGWQLLRSRRAPRGRRVG